MKTSFFIIILFFLFVYLFPVNAQTNIGLRVGLNVATLSGYNDLSIMNDEGAQVKMTSDFLPSYHMGVVVQSFLSHQFFIQSELLFSKQGKKDKNKKTKVSKDVSLSYIQLPVYAAYKYNIGSGLNFIIGVGPYFAYCISQEKDIYESHYKKFDMGLSAMSGIQWDNLQIVVGYDLGLINSVKNTSDLITSLPSGKNRNIKVAIACFL